MLRRVFVLLFVFALDLGGFCQSFLPPLIQCSPHQTSSKEIENKVTHFTATFIKDKRESEHRLLRQIFTRAHRSFFKNYKPYSQFNELIEKGDYDCLSATAFLSVVLTNLKFDFKIIETNYHIFLLVTTKEGPVLLETTDRFNGFETSANKIQTRIGNYQQNQLSEMPDNAYLYHCNLFREVKSAQLTGLLLFNQAVLAFNKHEWMSCSEKLDLSESVYACERVDELASLLCQAVSTECFDETTKAYIIKHHQKQLKKLQLPVASL